MGSHPDVISILAKVGVVLLVCDVLMLIFNHGTSGVVGAEQSTDQWSVSLHVLIQSEMLEKLDGAQQKHPEDQS